MTDGAYTETWNGQTAPTVLHVIGAGEYGGAEAQLAAQLEALQALGVKLTVAVFYEGQFAREVRELGLTVHWIRAKTPIGDALGVMRAASRAGAVLIHTHGVRASLAGRLAGQRNHVPVITTVHSDLSLDYGAWVKRRYS